MGWTVGINRGGRFNHCMRASNSRTFLGKATSSWSDPAFGVVAALGELARRAGRIADAIAHRRIVGTDGIVGPEGPRLTRLGEVRHENVVGPAICPGDPSEGAA